MSMILSALVGIGTRLLTGAIIEKVVILALEELVKKTSSKADDKLLTIVKDGLK